MMVTLCQWPYFLQEDLHWDALIVDGDNLENDIYKATLHLLELITLKDRYYDFKGCIF